MPLALTIPMKPMKLIEARMIELAGQVQADCAYCCTVGSIKDMGEKPMTVLVTMRCHHHNTYSFEVNYCRVDVETEERRDAVLMGRIARGIVEAHTASSNNPNFK